MEADENAAPPWPLHAAGAAPAPQQHAAGPPAAPPAANGAAPQLQAAAPAPAAGQNGVAAEEAAPPPPPPPRLVVDRPPGRPQPMETSTTAVSLQWAPVSCTTLSAVPVAVEYVINYQLQMQQVDEKSGGGPFPDSWCAQYYGTASFVQVKGLRPGRTYAARVLVTPIVTNFAGEVVVTPCAPSETILVATMPCPPMGQPAPQLASRGKKELKFKWEPPEETGGRPLEYTFEMTPPPEGWQGLPSSPEGFFQVYCGPERSYLAKRLVPGVQYCGRVKAANSEGESAWSPLAVFYTQATVPSWSPSDAPFVWDTTASSVTLGWPEPAANGGTVTGYEVEMDDGSGFRHVARSHERQCIVQGLRSGILYKFRVRAENEAGRSLWGPLGEGRTAAVAPAACSAPSVLGSSQTSLTIRWEPPEDDGGSAIQAYQVELRPKSLAAVQGLADEWLVAYEGANAACTIANLRAGCIYLIRVRAVTKVGPGPFSSAAMLQTAPGNPECPGAVLVAARHQTELALTWAPPAHDGGSPITTYRLEMCCLGGTEGPGADSGKGKSKVDPTFELAYLGPERVAVVQDLEAGHRYSFRCAAMSVQGSSGWGPVSQADTLPGPPYPVDSLHLVAAASTTLKLRWSQPYGRGAKVSGYVLELAPTAELQAAQQQAEQAASQQAAAAAAAAAQAALQQPGEAQGAAVGSDGGQLGELAPAAPQLQHHSEHAAEDGHGGLPNGHAAGKAGSHSGSVPDADALFRPAYQGGEPTCTVSGLEPHTEYTLRLRSLNAVGYSLSDAECFQTAPAAPSAPQGLQLQSASATALQAAWQAPLADHGAPVSAYQLEWARGGRTGTLPAAAWRSACQGPALQGRVEGLEAGTRYLLRARASNACGWGPWTEPLPATTAPDAPAAPAGLSVKAVGTAVRAAWEPAEDNGAPVTSYELEVAPAAGGAPGGFQLAASGDALSQRVSALEPNSRYALRVRAVNSVGPGPYSQEVAVQTSRAPPSPPAAVSAQLAAGEGGSGGSIDVSWQSAEQGLAQAACVSYEVEAEPPRSSGQSAVRCTCPGKAHGMAVTGLQPGTAYRLRVRGIGADGAGHGEWSEWSERIKMPGAPPPPRSASAALPASGPAGAASEPSKPQKRRGGGSGQPAAARTTSVVKTAVGKGPPRKGFAAWAHKPRRAMGVRFTYQQLLYLAGSLVAAVLGILLWLDQMVHAATKAVPKKGPAPYDSPING